MNADSVKEIRKLLHKHKIDQIIIDAIIDEILDKYLPHNQEDPKKLESIFSDHAMISLGIAISKGRWE